MKEHDDQEPFTVSSRIQASCLKPGDLIELGGLIPDEVIMAEPTYLGTCPLHGPEYAVKLVTARFTLDATKLSVIETWEEPNRDFEVLRIARR